MIRGLDGSAAQGDIPFESLTSDIRFGIFKAQQGNDGFDPYFWKNVKKATDLGIVPGAYFFAYPLPHLDPRDQAKMFFDRSRGFGSNKGELPPFIDLEWPEVIARDAHKGWKEWKCSPKQISNFAKELASEMTALWGVKPIIYIYDWWWECIRNGAPAYGFPEGADVSWAAEYDLWMAHYINRWPVPGEKPKVPPPFKDWRFWQFDGNGGLRLPNGADCDFCVFNGEQSDLIALADGPRIREADDFDIVRPTVEFG